RTAYASEMLRAMAAHVETDLTAAERLSLIDDEWALVRAGRHGAADYLTLAEGYGGEPISGVLDQVVGGLSFVHDYLTAGETRARFETFVRSLFRRSFAGGGVTPATGDTDERKALRATLIGALGTLGNDADLAGRARTAADRALAGSAALDSTIASAALRIAAQHGDARLFDALLAAAERASDPDE